MFVGSTAQAAPFAYISNGETNNVTVIDTATQTIVTTVPMGPGSSPYGVAVNAAGTRAYIGLNGTSSVKVIDTSTNTVIGTIGVGLYPSGLAVNGAGTRVYVANTGGNSVSVIDTSTNTVIATPTAGIGGPTGVAVNPAGTRVYVSNASGSNDPNATYKDNVSVIDTSSNTVIAGVKLPGYNAWGIVVNSAGTRVYVAYYRQDSNPPIGGSVAEIDAQTNQVIRSTATGPLAYGLAINPAGSRVYVSSYFFNTVTVVDTRCGDKLTTISLYPTNGGGYSIGLSVTPDGNRLYAAVHNSQSMKVIDTATNAIIGDIPVGTSNPNAFGVFIAPGVAPPPVPEPPVAAQVTGIELTQAIQDVANNVPLISGRRTFARVYVEADAADVAGVTARLTGLGAYSSGGSGVLVPLGAIVPSNEGGPRITVTSTPQRSNINDSFLFELPWLWTNFEGLRVHAELAGPGRTPVASCASDVLAQPVREFRTYTTLKIAFVRMGYKAIGSFPVLDDAFVEATSEEQRSSASWIRRTYPVSVLSSAPDFPLFDELLGQWVNRTSLFCLLAYDADEISLCAWRYVASRLAALEASSGFMGDADVAYGLIPQHPTDVLADADPNDALVRQFFTRGACCDDRASGGPAFSDTYAAHEIGHFLGRDHPVEASAECGHDGKDANYPYFFTFIAPPLSDPNTALAGFDVGDGTLAPSRPRSFLAPSSNFDIMGYCNPSWISDYTYRALAISLAALHPDIGRPGSPGTPQAAKAVKAAPQPGDWLMLYGHVAGDRSSAALINVQRVDRVFVVPPRPPGTLSFRLLAQGGGTLAEYFFDPVPVDDADFSGGANSTQFSFGHVVPFVPGTVTVQIIDTAAANAVLATLPVSANAPVVTNVATNGAPDPETGLLMLTWAASDPDGGALSFDIYATRDEGQTLKPLALAITTTSTQIDVRALAGGSTRFRVVASDGLHTGYAQSPPIVLPNQPPKPRILTPGADAKIYLGQVLNIEGEATDAQDGGIAGANLLWSSQQGSLGSGARVSTTTLPVGANLITLSVTNSVGLTATRSITITVDGNVGTPGPTLTAGPGQVGWQVAAGAVQLQSATLNLGNRGSGSVQFTASSSAPWLMLSASAGTAPAALTLSASPAGLAEGTVLDAYVFLQAVGFPDQFIAIPVRLAVGNTLEVDKGSPLPFVNLILRDGFE